MSSSPNGRRPSGKATDVISILERRIRGGDYLVAPLPTGRALAAELGVSYVTARKALQAMQDRGLLARGPTGRLRLGGPSTDGRVAQVAFLAPAFPSLDVMRWRLAIDRTVAAARCAVKSHFFEHWDDPVVIDVIERGDGAFLYPSSEALSRTLERRLRERTTRVVVVDQDWSAYGLPSLCLSPPRFVQALLDHCVSLGHRRIACLNTAPHDHAIAARIGQYRLWAAAHGMPAELIDEPVRPGEDAGPRARDVVARVLAQGGLVSTAVFTTTGACAVGAMRALHAAGLRPGRDLAVCTLNDDGLGDMLIPSLTAQAVVDPAPYLQVALDWILHLDRPWEGPLLVQPDACLVAARESTGAS
jgi:hypothetical protein